MYFSKSSLLNWYGLIFIVFAKITMDLSNIQQTQFSWWYTSNPSIITSLLPSLIYWELWRYRNKAIHDTIISPSWVLISTIQKSLLNILQAAKIKFHPSIFQPLLKPSSLIIGHARQRTVRVVHWSKPALGFVKLNSDEASQGKPGLSAGSGIVRDSLGNFIYAYSSFYGWSSTSFLAKARALFLGIKWSLGCLC